MRVQAVKQYFSHVFHCHVIGTIREAQLFTHSYVARTRSTRQMRNTSACVWQAVEKHAEATSEALPNV